MIDPSSMAAGAVAQRGWFAPIAVFAAGLASCFGPCAAPRFLAIVSCGGNDPRRMRPAIFFFLCGLIGAYAAFGATTSLIGRVVDISTFVFALAGAGMVVCGLYSLFRADASNGNCAHETDKVPLSAGGTFLLGASFAFVIAPCCTPLVAAIVAYTTAQGDPVYGSSLLALFALGHGLPVALLGAGAGLLAERIRRLALSQATAVVSACLMVIVGCLYACIA